jgi:hypothetical protein
MHDLQTPDGEQCRCLKGNPHYPALFRCPGFEQDPRAFSDPVIVTGEKAVSTMNTEKMRV